MNSPLEGSLANVCIEFKIPDLTRKVPLILNAKVAIESMTVQFFNEFLFSKTKTQCSNVVRANHGIKETFSTGSQNQKPPHPNS